MTSAPGSTATPTTSFSTSSASSETISSTAPAPARRWTSSTRRSPRIVPARGWRGRPARRVRRGCPRRSRASVGAWREERLGAADGHGCRPAGSGRPAGSCTRFEAHSRPGCAAAPRRWHRPHPGPQSADGASAPQPAAEPRRPGHLRPLDRRRTRRQARAQRPVLLRFRPQVQEVSRPLTRPDRPSAVRSLAIVALAAGVSTAGVLGYGAFRIWQRGELDGT